MHIIVTTRDAIIIFVMRGLPRTRSRVLKTGLKASRSFDGSPGITNCRLIHHEVQQSRALIFVRRVSVYARHGNVRFALNRDRIGKRNDSFGVARRYQLGQLLIAEPSTLIKVSPRQSLFLAGEELTYLFIQRHERANLPTPRFL